jgi:flagellar motor switch protein FliN/FliY
MKNSAAGRWMGKIEAELARELGQPVTVTAGGELPQAARSLRDVLEVPGTRLFLAADQEDVAALLVEGRVVEAGQTDAETVRELWSGILASVASRLGGKTSGAEPGEFPATPCTLRLGNAVLRLALSVDEEEAGEAREPEPGPPGQRSPQNFDLLLEVALDASVRFGSRELELRELLELGPGDVVELDRHVADPVDLIVGDKIVARGEVVLVNGNFGLRVTEVAEPVRRLESIRCMS